MGASQKPFNVGDSGTQKNKLGSEAFQSANGIQKDNPNVPHIVTAMTMDQSGNLWIASEDRGISCYSPLTHHLHNFDELNKTVEKSSYAIACDPFGRIWAGTARHGVCVFNGQDWKNYDVPNGPIGERIFDIAVCPTDGDVWMANNAGLTRYSQNKNSWSHFTREDGLPSDQLSCLAFDPAGNLYIGTQDSGIAFAERSSDYKITKTFAGPADDPHSLSSSGLPSSLINDLLVTKNGTVYAATNCGLAWSHDGGQSWKFLRGADQPEKERLRYPSSVSNAKEAQAALAEDYVDALAEDLDGHLWVGYRKFNWDTVDPESLSRSSSPLIGNSRAIVFAPAGDTFVGGNGVKKLEGGVVYPINVDATDQKLDLHSNQVSPFPANNSVVTDAMLEEQLHQLDAVKVSESQSVIAAALPDDWRTQGDWVGRNGKYFACLSAMIAGDDYLWRPGEYPVSYGITFGPHHDQGDFTRYWIGFNYLSDPSCLELPTAFLDSRIARHLTTPAVYRRLSFWNDHGEAYSSKYDGPDLYCTVRLPPGKFWLSIYEMRGPQIQDFRISVREHDQSKELNELSGFTDAPELAHSRACEYSTGVYKRFFVKGQRDLTIQVKRNYSLNTNIAAVMLDPIEEKCPPYFMTWEQWEKRNHTAGVSTSQPNSINIADQLLAKLEAIEESAPENEPDLRRDYILLAQRYFSDLSNAGNPAQAESRKHLATCLFRLHLYSEWEDIEHQLHEATPRDIEKSFHWDGVTDSYAGKTRSMLEQLAAKMHASPSLTD
jgi:sugar lactone lactonase YvrE